MIPAAMPGAAQPIVGTERGMCVDCAHADSTCEVYPQQTTTCVNFAPVSREVRKRWELWMSRRVWGCSSESRDVYWPLLTRLCSMDVQH